MQSPQNSAGHKAKCSRSPVVIVVVICNYNGQKKIHEWGGISSDTGQNREWDEDGGDIP